ncbi:unnamed protein product [Ranitomeya imitator]|uniref:CIP2A N-terminal domain-containing protein n=1 Tax=Ranitomeya imitator TaxID=111125 RepID=A0ABN9LNI7_9NEOB|nr:unnamed protein product [Ranitomeya imitator]
MEPLSCMKSLLLAVAQYRGCKNEANGAALQRQLEAILGLKLNKLFVSSHVLPGECVSSLVELMEDPSTSPAVTLKTVQLLTSLASDIHTKETLHTTYNVTSVLAGVVHRYSAILNDPVLLQHSAFAKINLQYQSFACKCQYRGIDFIFDEQNSPEDDLTMPTLGLLANLCRNNLSVQTHVKSLLPASRSGASIFPASLL